MAAGGDRRFAAIAVAGTLEDASSTIFWKDKRGPIGLRVESGDGTIIALADEYPL